MKTVQRRTRRVLALGATVAAVALAVSACSSGGSTTASQDSSKFTFLGLTSNTTPADTLKTLASTTCSAENTAQPLSTDAIEQTALDQKVQLLAGQNALPSLAVAAGAPSTTAQYIKSGQYADVTKALDDAGVSDAILPAAASTIKALYGGTDLYAIPNEFNIEGIWYNKKIFTDHNISVPTTWDDFVSVTKTLQSDNVQPLTADGKDGWPVTRYVGAYLFRDLGPNALKDVADGKAKLTDPAYVKAADAVAALGKSGAFGKNVASNDYNGEINDFLSGKAAMMYMGSWALSNFNDPKQNLIGSANIGFMPFPAVTGGKGSIDQVPSNVGQPLMFAKKSFGKNSAAWLKCIAENYGDTVLSKSNVISGFKLNKTHKLDALAQTVEDQITGSKSSVLWFEALMNEQQTTLSQQNGGLLGSGALSGADFMAKIQGASS